MSRSMIILAALLGVVAAGLLIGLSQWSAQMDQTAHQDTRPIDTSGPSPVDATNTANNVADADTDNPPSSDDPDPVDNAQTTSPQTTQTESTTLPEPPTPHPVLGDPGAPVTIVEFAEFYCPYCAKFMWETFPQIEANYIETGKVRYVFRNWPVHGLIAIDAAVAGECAHDQDAFWAYSDEAFERVFPNRNLSNTQTLSMDELKDIAADIGLNMNAFNRCIDDYTAVSRQCRTDYESCQGETSDQNACNSALVACLEASDKFNDVMSDNRSLSDYVNALPPEDRGRADRLGTPTFFINNRLLVGAQPYSAFERLIEEELNRASSGP